MIKFLSSRNSNYSAMQDGRTLILNVNGENRWKREFDYSVFSILLIANSGLIIAAADDNIIKIPPEANSTPEEIRPLSKKALLETDSVITSIKINTDGTKLCVGIRQRTMDTAEKIKAYFSIPGIKKRQIRNTIRFIDLRTNEVNDYFENMSPGKSADKFLWDISPDFFWLVVAEPAHKATKVTLAKVRDSVLQMEETIPEGTEIKSIRVNAAGIVAVETENEVGRQIRIMNEDKNTIEMKPDWILCALGSNFLAIRNSTPEIIVKTFDNYTKYYASFTALREMKIPWDIKFLDKDFVNILTFENEEFVLTRTSLNQVAVDAKRWSFILAREQEAKEQETKQTTEAEERNEAYNRKKLALAIKLANINASNQKKALEGQNEQKDPAGSRAEAEQPAGYPFPEIPPAPISPEEAEINRRKAEAEQSAGYPFPEIPPAPISPEEAEINRKKLEKRKKMIDPGSLY